LGRGPTVKGRGLGDTRPPRMKMSKMTFIFVQGP
jgi:hypothetical protein